MPEILRQLHPVARKPHVCNYCMGKIAKGETYHRDTLKGDYVYDWLAHDDCDEIVSVLDMSQLCADDDGISQEHFEQIVNDAYDWLTETKEPQPKRTLHEKVKYVLEHKDELSE